jgi:formylglycine-generating enzyme required for sulfatase activity
MSLTPLEGRAVVKGRVAVDRRWCEIPAGIFTMGCDGPDAVPGDGEGPTRQVSLDGFRIASTTVTNAEFADFVRATRYITDAETQGTSFVFYLQVGESVRQAARQVVSGLPWWLPIENASWQRPEGPGSHVRNRPSHPVVHVSWNDAMAYCEWARAQLPNEAQWERAARGGQEGLRFAWGDDLYDEAGLPRCNVFRGRFPDAPVAVWAPQPVDAGSGEPNGFGLYNVCGNVWEWCAETLDSSQRPLRGGSFLCHDSYCNRYRVPARSSNTPDTASSNIGFRVVSQWSA